MNPGRSLDDRVPSSDLRMIDDILLNLAEVFTGHLDILMKRGISKSKVPNSRTTLAEQLSAIDLDYASNKQTFVSDEALLYIPRSFRPLIRSLRKTPLCLPSSVICDAHGRLRGEDNLSIEVHHFITGLLLIGAQKPLSTACRAVCVDAIDLGSARLIIDRAAPFVKVLVSLACTSKGAHEAVRVTMGASKAAMSARVALCSFPAPRASILAQLSKDEIELFLTLLLVANIPLERAICIVDGLPDMCDGSRSKTALSRACLTETLRHTRGATFYGELVVPLPHKNTSVAAMYLNAKARSNAVSCAHWLRESEF